MTRISNVAPIVSRRCPVHKQLVAFDGEGRALGKCQGCATEAAAAEKRLELRALQRIVA